MFRTLNLWKLLRRISDLINMFPFAGKSSIRSILLWAYLAPYERRLVRTVLALLYLAFMMLAHFIQATMGFALYHKTALVQVQIISLIYLTVNALVVYSQGILFLRTVGYYWRFRGRYSSGSSYKPGPFAYQFLGVLATFAGQFIFIFAYLTS